MSFLDLHGESVENLELIKKIMGEDSTKIAILNLKHESATVRKYARLKIDIIASNKYNKPIKENIRVANRYLMKCF